MKRILAINPGSTSTKLAIFEDENIVEQTTLRHDAEEISKFDKIADQYSFRYNVIMNFLKDKNYNLKSFDAIVGRGGLLHPIPGGTFLVNEDMLDDLRSAKYGEHASNLGAILAYKIAKSIGKPAYIVDPVVVDEMIDIARLSGMPELPRKSILHALNQRAVAYKVAKDMGKEYKECNFIVAHMGGGISIGAHKKGKIVDVNNALDGDGPFTPERSGNVPVNGLLKMCFSGKYTQKEILKKIKGKGGLVAYLGTNSTLDVENKVKAGNVEYKKVYEAMAYQVSKWIGKTSAIFKGEVDAIILTGGVAYDKDFCKWIEERVNFIAPVKVIAGEMEMEALANGALRVLEGKEKALIYEKN
jgi:butyrate kinase